MKSQLHWISQRGEAVYDALKQASGLSSADADIHLEPYFGYSTETSIVVRGRVLRRKAEQAPTETPSIFDNIRRMVSLFLTDEVEGVRVSCGPLSASSDEEGYYALELPRGDLGEGWQDIMVTTETGISATHAALIRARTAKFGVISDIDDTIMHTSAWSLRQNIWTSMTGSVDSREVFSDAVNLLKSLQSGGNPIFYVSSSPWNFHAFLDAVFQRAGVPRGPKFLRDYGVDDQKFIKNEHGDHKGAAIDTILAANADLAFYLIGDSGQHDPVVYRDACLRHPGRIKDVYIRHAGGDLGEEDRLPLDEIRANGIDVYVGETFDSPKA